MAPSSKLKQSSIDSFLRSKQTTSIPPLTPQPATAAASEYERIRQETIRRNQEFLQKLGIAAPKNPTPLPPKRTPKPHPSPAPSPSLRRSTRKRPFPAPSSSDDGADADADPAAPPDPSEPSFVDSSVFRYACDASDDSSVLSSKVHPSSSSIMGFRTVGKAFRDPSLAKIYSIDVCFLNKNRFLLAACGHGGFLSVYGGGGGEDGCDGDVEGEEKGERVEPLLSWKGSWSWISGVNFVEDNPMLMVSSSNDGFVVVWDITKQPALSSSCSPPVVAKLMELHAGGIFAMDRLGCSIATASKDSSVGISRLTPAGKLVAERKVTSHHSGVIRGVCFGLPEPCALTIKSEHSTGINTVEWCTRKSLLLSASKDPTLHLYDVRNSAGPVLKLEGHVESTTRSCYQIYRPCFVEGGKTIATPGQGSRKISLYDVDSGTMISQGMIGYDANLVVFTDGEEHPRLWSAGRQINQLCPLTV
ncbi:uncharacterized protein [Elaeis guineensis]|uniref:uncharacterized protein isoform X2 n=1 Tax=Elaeis guineensis var. tenera TaxID=51953 RepID=UPI003C6D8FC2